MKKFRIIFFGTPEFACPALRSLYHDNYEICLVVTQPDKPVGREQVLTPPPIKKLALELALLVSQKLNIAELKNLKADVGIVVAYGKIIPKEILDLFPFGLVNIHPSLLPKYRGPSPIQSAIFNGDNLTGVSLIKLDEQMDHGPIISSVQFPIASEDTAESLHDQLAEAGAELLLKTLPAYLSKKLEPKPQDDSLATFTSLLEKVDGHLDWQKSAQELDRQIRAYYPWPGSFGSVNIINDNKKTEEVKVKILKARPSNDLQFQPEKQHPGTITALDNKLLIECGNGWLEIILIQPVNKQKMTALEFINGYLN